MVLICINLSGWVLRQLVVEDRAEIWHLVGYGKLNQMNKKLHFALRRQAEKLNLLLMSLLPRRVFLKMKYDIVADAARSYNTICGISDDENQNEHCLHPSHQVIQLKTTKLPKMYLKEYENVSVVYANVTGFWDNVSTVTCHGESGSQSSLQAITLIDRLLSDLFRGLARRNNCLPIRLHGHHIFFVSGLPAEEGYEYESKSARKMVDENCHARDAIRMGLDLINAINTVVKDVSRHRFNHKINLNVRVGVHSGRVACGVLGFIGDTSNRSEFGSRWQYNVWGRDVRVASCIESSGRPGWVHVSQATVDHITKKDVSTEIVTEVNHNPTGVNLRNRTLNHDPSSSENKDNFTFERRHEEHKDQFLRDNQIDTYFVVSDTKDSITKPTGKPTTNCKNVYVEDSDDHYSYGEDIESLILQSVEHQLQTEEKRWQHVINSTPGTDITSTQLMPTTTTTVAGDWPMSTAALISAIPISTSRMMMNRHRRSKYELETQHATTPNERLKRWKVDVFGGYDSCDLDKVKSKSNDKDLFRLAKSQLLLLCVVITLFVVNVTTMPWTLLLGITFITSFVVIAGELIYVMALLIDWIPRPKFCSTVYVSATVADDDEFYHHYDSDNYSDSSSSSNDSDGCLKCLLPRGHSNTCLLIARIFKPWSTNTTRTTQSSLDNSDRHWWCLPKWCCCLHCHRCHCWFTKCIDNDGGSSYMSSDDSDIESRLGFRNENAIIAATGRMSPSQLQNRLQPSQSINRNHDINQVCQRHRRPKRKYQDEERRTWFFWLVACSEMFVLLLVCLLALLNAFTCEPVTLTEINTVYNQPNVHNGSFGFNIPTVNSTREQQPRSPLTCLWPQYAVLTCCLASVSIAISFPIYYGSLPTLRMKVVMLFIMIGVFAVAFIHFTHRHIFIAASVLSLTPSCCSKGETIHYTINATITSNDHHQAIHTSMIQNRYLEDQQMPKLQVQEQQQRAANMNTAIATVYVVVFITAILVCSVYAHCLKKRLAQHKVKSVRDTRRLAVLRTAHQRTLRALVPDHVADWLRRSGSVANDADKEHGGTWRKGPGIIDGRLIQVTNTGQQNRELNLRHISPPLYHQGYQAVVVMFATIVQDHLPGGDDNNRSSGHHCHRQLALFQDIFSEFDHLLDSQKFRGQVDKIKIVGTNTYMVAVGLHQHEQENMLAMQREETRRRNHESYRRTDQDGKNYIYNDRDINSVNEYDIISANNVTLALDFVRDMRRVLHHKWTNGVTISNSFNSQPVQMTLRVGVNVGPIVAGLIGCNDGNCIRPQFDVWGNTVNVAKEMDTTGVSGSTQVTNCVVEVMKSIKDPKYEFEIRTKINKDNKRITYFVRENFDCFEDQHSIQQQHQQKSKVHKNCHLNIEPGQQQQQLQLQFQHPAAVRPLQNAHTKVIPQLEHNQSSSLPLSSVPVVTVHPQHSHYNAMLHQELQHKYSELQKTPPPARSPSRANTRRILNTQIYLDDPYYGECKGHSEKRQQSRGIKLSHEKQQLSQRTPASADVVTYARPLQKQQKQKNNQSSSQSCSTQISSIPQGLVLMFGDDSHNMTTHVKPTCVSNHATSGTTMTNTTHLNCQQQPRRPNMLPLQNTTTSMIAVSSKNFDADRPLPAPPRSSDTVAGRQRHHHDPRWRRWQHKQLPTTNKHQAGRPLKNEQVVSGAWPSPSSFRSPISTDSFVGISSAPSSSSSSESTDAGDTTTSNNNYNTTTTNSSSDDSFGPTTTEDGGGVDRVDIDDFDTAASSAVVSSVYHRYRQQQHILLSQCSPTTTANSSPVRRSSSFRSPLSGGDVTAASSSSLRSPPVVGHSNMTSFSGTQSLNRRRIRPSSTTNSGANSSSRRRKRRQQQQILHTTTERSTPPSSTALEAIGVTNNTTISASEKYVSPPSSPWKKQQLQRRQVIGKEQGTSAIVAGPDFTDEIRRILLFDQRHGNVRQQPRGIIKKEEQQVDKHLDISNDGKEVICGVKQSSSEKEQHRAVIVATSRKPNKDDENNQRNKIDSNNDTDIAELLSPTVMENVSSFEEREKKNH